MPALTLLAGAAAALATASSGGAADVSHTDTVMVTAASTPWVACSDAAHVAYRTVPARLNTHNAFSQPIRVKLADGQSCSSLR